ncbi:hypothetical protein FKP32DRAFT_1607208 [Trametes sanguinea]|nr:hypothetical protein FKP32DRAFT_1607208 [Trametes sanguinea]
MHLLSISFAEYMPHVCLALSFILLLYLLVFQYRRSTRAPAETSYAFSAATMIRQRPPTVLQFSARVPPGAGATPTMLQTIEGMSPERRPNENLGAGNTVTASSSRVRRSLSKPSTTKRVTRSASRSSLAQEAVHAPMRDTVKLVRQKNPIRGNGKHDASMGRQYTYWFQTESSQPIERPPHLHVSCALRPGDLFWHKTRDQSQFWLRLLDADSEREVWKVVEPGYERADGRRLTITPKKQVLSWVGGDWGSRRVSASQWTGPENA